MPDQLSSTAAPVDTPEPPVADRLALALGLLVPRIPRGAGDPGCPWTGLRGAVVDLVELTAAAQVLGIHARLSVGVGLGGLPGSRRRAREAAAAVVLRHRAVLRACGAAPADWRPEALRAAADVVDPVAAREPLPVEALPRLVAEQVALALAHQGGTPADVVPPVARGLGYALGLFVLVAPDDAAGGSAGPGDGTRHDRARA